MFSACGQELLQDTEMAYTLFHLGGVLRYVLHSFASEDI